MIGGWPSPQSSPPSLLSWCPLGRFSGCGAFTVVLVFATLPVENAPALVTTLNDEPGGNVISVARLTRGCAGSWRYWASILSSFVPSSVVYLLGSNVGFEARAKIAPVDGLMATTPASCPGSFCSMAW